MLVSFKNLFVFFTLVSIAFSSCKKEEVYVPEKYAEESVLYPEGIEERDALLMAMRDYVRVEITGNSEISVDFALAQFTDKKFKAVGQVKLNNDSLVKTSANFYVSNLDKINFKLNPGTLNKWSITGGNGFTAFNRTLTVKMPAQIVFDSLPKSISLNNNITLRVKDFPLHAQAIIWQLKDVDGNLIQKETFNNEWTLTAAELSKLVPGKNCLIKVAAYSLEKWENGGKKYVFVNEMIEKADIELN